MITDKRLKEIERNLEGHGLSDHVRRNIRNSKICLVDDKVSDLKSFQEGLKREGFNNIIPFESIESVNSLIVENYDLIILDLNDVAKEVSKNDGLGVLEQIKRKKPKQLIYVISGKSISPEDGEIISKANLVRKKPVLVGDLADDVEIILKVYKDKFWTGLEVIKELNVINAELEEKLGWWKRLKLSYHRSKLLKNIEAHEGDVVLRLKKIMKIIRVVGSTTDKIGFLVEKIAS